MTTYYDNTRLSTYKKCPRKYYLRHIRHWVREGTAPALVFGLSWHEAMDIVWGGANSDKSNRELAQAGIAAFMQKWEEEGYPSTKAIQENPAILDQYIPRTPYIALEMLFNYIELRRPWIRDRTVIAIEQPFVVEIPTSEDSFYIGRIDKIVEERNGDIIGIEHKTTSLYDRAKGFRQSYTDSWSPNSQVDGYLHNLHNLYGRKAKGVYVDAALVHKTVHDKFKFIPIDRQVQALHVFLGETQDWINRIEGEKELLSRVPDKKGATFSVFPKNTESCADFSGCSFRDICKFSHSPNILDEPPAGYRVDKWEPFNILNVQALGLPPEDE